MSLKLRGAEVTITIASDGIRLGGSLLKLTDFSETLRSDLNEDDYLGEQATDLDTQFHGWDLSFAFDVQDAVVIELVEDLVDRMTNQEAPPEVTITAIYNFREPGARGKMKVYRQVFLKPGEETVGGRKEKVKGKFEGKCKHRQVLNV